MPIDIDACWSNHIIIYVIDILVVNAATEKSRKESMGGYAFDLCQ